MVSWLSNMNKGLHKIYMSCERIKNHSVWRCFSKCKLLANVLVKREVRSGVWDSEKQSCRDLVTRGSENPISRWWQSGKGTVSVTMPRKDNPRGQFLGPQLGQTSDRRARKVIASTIMDWVYHVQGSLLPGITFTTSKPSLHSFRTSAFNISMPVVLGLSRESELIGCIWFFIRDWFSQLWKLRSSKIRRVGG